MRDRMSGFSARRSMGGPPPSFFSLCCPALSTRQSATAAAMTATSTGSAASQAASISAAVSTGTSLTPAGKGSWVGPETSTVSAPSAARAAAMAWPCLPEEWFEIYRTGSIGSRVGPLVTSARFPASFLLPISTCSIAAMISSGSAMRPDPTSPHASSPEPGPTRTTPRISRVAKFAWVAGCPHIIRFIVGAISTGLSEARRAVVARSSASPAAMRAIRSALAGATTTRSASRESRI